MPLCWSALHTGMSVGVQNLLEAHFADELAEVTQAKILEDSQILEVIFSEHNYVYWKKMWFIRGFKSFSPRCGKACKDGYYTPVR